MRFFRMAKPERPPVEDPPVWISVVIDAVAQLKAEIVLSREQRTIEFEWFKSHTKLATKHDLEQLGNRMAEAIQQFANRVEAKFDEIGASVDGIVADVQFLKDKITELQNSAGTVTPEDQARLDAIEARIGTLAGKTAELDASTESAPAPNP